MSCDTIGVLQFYVKINVNFLLLNSLKYFNQNCNNSKIYVCVINKAYGDKNHNIMHITYIHQ